MSRGIPSMDPDIASGPNVIYSAGRGATWKLWRREALLVAQRSRGGEQRRRAEEQRRRAEEHRRRAEEQRRRVVQALATSSASSSPELPCGASTCGIDHVRSTGNVGIHRRDPTRHPRSPAALLRNLKRSRKVHWQCHRAASQHSQRCDFPLDCLKIAT